MPKLNPKFPLTFLILALTVLSGATSFAETRTRVLVDGAEIHGSNGIGVDSNDKVYVTSAVGGTIHVLNSRSGRAEQVFDRADGLTGVDDIAFAPDGTPYFTEFFEGSVARLNADGTKEIVANVGPGVNAITFSDTGRLFVTRVFLGDHVYEIFPDGSQAPRLVTAGIGGLNAMDFGPDGKLYGPLWFNGVVARLDVDTGQLETVYSGLHTPAAVKFDESGELYVLEQHEGELWHIDLVTGEGTIVATPGEGADNFAFDSRGNVYSTNAHSGEVFKTGRNGHTRTLVRGGLSMASGIEVLPRPGGGKSVFVADTQSLREYAARSGRERSVVHAAVGSTESVITPLSTGRIGDNLTTTSWFGGSVQVWNPWTQTVVENHFDFAAPINALGFQGDLVVAELGSGCVVRRELGTQTREELLCGLYVPTGLAADDNNLWVSDWATGLVWQIVVDGQVAPQIVASGLTRPEGMAVTSGGDLLVTEPAAQKLTRIAADGTTSVVLEDLDFGMQGPAGYPPTWLLSDVAVDECDTIYLNLDNSSQVLRVKTGPCRCRR